MAPSRFAYGEDDGEEHLERRFYGEEVVKELQEKGILSAVKETSGNRTRSLGMAPFHLISGTQEG